jgi:hypothetical protein
MASQDNFQPKLKAETNAENVAEESRFVKGRHTAVRLVGRV